MYHNTYKHAGLKKPRTRRRYGDATHLPTAQKTDRLALKDISTETENLDDDIVFSDVSESKGDNLDNAQKIHTISSSVAKQPQSISSNGVGLGNNIQVCSTAQNVSFCTRSEPQVTTAISTPLTSIFSQLSLPLLVQSLTSAGPATSSASMQSVLNSLISPKPLQLASSISQISMPSQQSTQGTITYNVKPANTKSDRPFFLHCLQTVLKSVLGAMDCFEIMEKCQLLFWDTWNVTGIRKMANGTWGSCRTNNIT